MIDQIGFFIMVASPVGLRVMWNGATHVHIKVSGNFPLPLPIWVAIAAIFNRLALRTLCQIENLERMDQMITIWNDNSQFLFKLDIGSHDRL